MAHKDFTTLQDTAAGRSPTDWSCTTLGELANFINGDRGANYPKQSDYVAAGVPFVNTGHIEETGRLDLGRMHYITRASFDRLRSGRLAKGDIIYCLRGSTIGKTARVDLTEGAIASSLVIIRAKPGVSQAYLYHFLAGPLGQSLVRQHDNGSAQPNLSVSAISKYPILLPPLPEQKAIAHILGTLDDKIELNRRMNQTLEAIAQALFKEWFSEPAEDALPRAWRRDAIYRAANVIYGAPFSSAQFNTKQVGKPLIRIRDLASETPEVYTPEQHPKGYLVQPGDILVGMDGEFRAYLWGGEQAWLNQRVCVFAPKPPFSAPFVRNSIAAPLAEIEATEAATTVIHLGKNDIDRFSIIVPDPDTLAKYNTVTVPMYDRIVANKRETRTLTQLRDTLLPKLLSGELRIKDAQIRLQAHS